MRYVTLTARLLNSISVNDEALDLDSIPAAFQSDDPCGPDIFRSAILPLTDAPESIRKFRALASTARITMKTLPELRAIYERQDEEEAIRLLKQKARIDPAEDILPHDAANLMRSPPTHAIDAFCAVGNEIGLEGLLPNTPTDMRFQLHLQPQRAKLSLTDKHSYFGCDVRGRTYYVGMSNSRKVYLLFRPEVAAPKRTLASRHTGGGINTALADDRLDAFAAYWAWLLKFLRTHSPVRSLSMHLTHTHKLKDVTNLR